MARMRLAALWGDPARAAGLLVLGGYVAISFATTNLYPFSVFDMYSRPRTTASRIVARDASGAVAEVDRFEAWRCDRPIDLSPAVCGPPESFFYSPYLDQGRADYVAAHGAADGAPGGAPEDVVRRIWRLDAPGPPRIDDCLLARCTAVRR
jgi:hypothetical protein